MRILLVRLDHIGDVVLTVPPMVASMRAADPSAEIDVLTSAMGAQLLAGNRNISRLIAYDAPWSVIRYNSKLFLFKRIVDFFVRSTYAQLNRYDSIIYASLGYWEILLTWHLSQRRIGFKTPYRRWLHRWADYFVTTKVPFDASSHMVSNCLRLLQALIPSASFVSEPGPTITLTGGRRQRVSARLPESEPFVLLHPGHPDSYKNWPYRNMAELAERICDEFSVPCVLAMSPDERATNLERFGETKDGRISIAETRDFVEYAYVASKAAMLIVNDGGPAHIAAALGVPTVVIFGPTDERVYAPLGEHVRVVRSCHPMAPCSWPWHHNRPCCVEKSCLTSLSVDDVFDAAKSLWKARKLDRTLETYASLH